MQTVTVEKHADVHHYTEEDLNHVLRVMLYIHEIRDLPGVTGSWFTAHDLLKDQKLPMTVQQVKSVLNGLSVHRSYQGALERSKDKKQFKITERFWTIKVSDMRRRIPAALEVTATTTKEEALALADRIHKNKGDDSELQAHNPCTTVTPGWRARVLSFAKVGRIDKVIEKLEELEFDGAPEEVETVVIRGNGGRQAEPNITIRLPEGILHTSHGEGGEPRAHLIQRDPEIWIPVAAVRRYRGAPQGATELVIRRSLAVEKGLVQ